MAERLQPPSSLSDLRWFAVRYDRDRAVFHLVVPTTRETHLLGSAVKTREYFTRIGMEYLGGRAMDAAYAFGASQALVGERRAFGLDLTDVRVDPVVGALDGRLTAERLLGGIEGDDEDEGVI